MRTTSNGGQSKGGPVSKGLRSKDLAWLQEGPAMQPAAPPAQRVRDKGLVCNPTCPIRAKQAGAGGKRHSEGKWVRAVGRPK